MCWLRRRGLGTNFVLRNRAQRGQLPLLKVPRKIPCSYSAKRGDKKATLCSPEESLCRTQLSWQPNFKFLGFRIVREKLGSLFSMWSLGFCYTHLTDCINMTGKQTRELNRVAVCTCAHPYTADGIHKVITVN